MTGPWTATAPTRFGVRLSELRAALAQADPREGILLRDQKNSVLWTGCEWRLDSFTRGTDPAERHRRDDFPVSHVLEVPSPPGAQNPPLFVFVPPEPLAEQGEDLRTARPGFLQGEDAENNSGDYDFPSLDIIS